MIMERLLRDQQDFILGICAFLFIGAILSVFWWGVGIMITGVGRSVNIANSDAEKVVVDLEGAKQLVNELSP
ncbi:MAG: hypothetical protein RL681_137 [Candidatus Parcubacteria bacterium]|jgi:hypothetical protein